MKNIDDLLDESQEIHGHVCPGQVLGIRMAIAGCRQIEIGEPKKSRSLIVWVEIDRCATDAIQSVTGCRLGKRTLKYVDYGKMAATFLNTETGKAVRVVARDDSRETSRDYAPAGATAKDGQLHAYRVMPETELLIVQRVEMVLRQEDLPGPPIGRVPCRRCGEWINDHREERVDGVVLCRACANGAYYRLCEPAVEVSRP